MSSASKVSFLIRHEAFFRFETSPCGALLARGMPTVASESLPLIGLPRRPSPAVCCFSAPNKCQTIRDGTGDV